jgi:hypothetical protein
MHELIELWKRLLGDPPADEQFDFWVALHTTEVVRQAILKTAGKNLALGKTMDLDYKIRFASKVMLTITERRDEHAANRTRLRDEMEAR